MNGGHGQIVQQHVAKESKQGQEHVLLMLKTLASHSLSKKVALFPQPAGVHGQVALQHAIAVSRQELEHVLITLQAPTMTRKVTKKVATSKNAAMTLGQHGLHGIHVPIVVQVLLNKNVREKGSSKYPRVHKKANRFKPNLKRRIAIIEATGGPVSSNTNQLILH